jgi:hypothetical protein
MFAVFHVAMVQAHRRETPSSKRPLSVRGNLGYLSEKFNV